MEKIEIIYEDDYIIIVNKPNGILIHRSYYARNIKDHILLDMLLEQLGYSTYPVHRLDRKTSGAIVLCKNKDHVSQFQEALTSDNSVKTYYGVVRGFISEKGIIDSPVKHPENKTYKKAETHFNSCAQITLDVPVHPYPTSRYSLVRLIPKTGRIHQLRIHLNKVSHPLVGDYKYGDRFHNRMFEQELGANNLFLHAYSIEFKHPYLKKMIKINANFPMSWIAIANQFEWQLP